MSLYNSTFESFQKNYLGAVSMAIIAQSCIGAAAVMYILSNGTSFFQIVQMTIITVLCMSVNTSILAQFSSKVVFNLIIASVIGSIIAIIINTAFI